MLKVTLHCNIKNSVLNVVLTTRGNLCGQTAAASRYILDFENVTSIRREVCHHHRLASLVDKDHDRLPNYL
jgi:hypothetical protein